MWYSALYGSTQLYDWRRKACTCCDGSVLRQKGLGYSHMGMKIFCVYLVINGWVAISGDVLNAYDQSSIPKEEEQ
jgi:hypothetical protein